MHSLISWEFCHLQGGCCLIFDSYTRRFNFGSWFISYLHSITAFVIFGAIFCKVAWLLTEETLSFFGKLFLFLISYCAIWLVICLISSTIREMCKIDWVISTRACCSFVLGTSYVGSCILVRFSKLHMFSRWPLFIRVWFSWWGYRVSPTWFGGGLDFFCYAYYCIKFHMPVYHGSDLISNPWQQTIYKLDFKCMVWYHGLAFIV